MRGGRSDPTGDLRFRRISEIVRPPDPVCDLGWGLSKITAPWRINSVEQQVEESDGVNPFALLDDL